MTQIRGGTNNNGDNMSQLQKLMNRLTTETPVRSEPMASASEKPKTQQQQQPAAQPAKRLSLRDLMRTTVQDPSVQNLREDLDQAKEVDSEGIRDYVRFRWELAALAGVPVGMPWEKQVEVLAPKARRSQAIKRMVAAVEGFHGNDFLKATLDEVMEYFGAPLHTQVSNLKELQKFLEGMSRQSNAVVAKSPKESDEGITLLEDPADQTNHDTVTYLPKHGSKVARDSWPVLREWYQQLYEEARPIEALRNAATPRLTPFKVSDKERGDRIRRGSSGKLFVMDADGQWAVLLGVSRDDQGRAMASIEGQAGLNSQITPTEWDHHRHCLKNPKDADVVIKINQALEDLNERQRRRAKEALKAFEGFEGTLSADLEDRSLSRILEGEAGTVAVCVPNFWIRKKNGKVKSGYFGAIFRIQDQELVLDDAVAAECFCFAKTLLVGKKMMFRIGTRKNSRTGQDEAVVDLDVGAFCRKNGFKGRLSNDDFQSLIMLAQLVRNRLNREDVYAPEAPPPKGEDEDEDNDQEAGFEENSSTDAPAVASEPQGS